MSARRVKSKGLGKFLWFTPWKFGFKLMQMQNASSILPWWLCKVIHIKTLSLSSEKYSALPSKWKCISITIAPFFHCISSFFFFLLFASFSLCLCLPYNRCYIFLLEDLWSSRCTFLNNYLFKHKEHTDNFYSARKFSNHCDHRWQKQINSSCS